VVQGVAGTDDERAPAEEENGIHAVSVDVTGTSMQRYCLIIYLGGAK